MQPSGFSKQRENLRFIDDDNFKLVLLSTLLFWQLSHSKSVKLVLQLQPCGAQLQCSSTCLPLNTLFQFNPSQGDSVLFWNILGKLFDPIKWIFSIISVFSDGGLTAQSPATSIISWSSLPHVQARPQGPPSGWPGQKHSLTRFVFYQYCCRATLQKDWASVRFKWGKDKADTLQWLIKDSSYPHIIPGLAQSSHPRTCCHRNEMFPCEKMIAWSCQENEFQVQEINNWWSKRRRTTLYWFTACYYFFKKAEILIQL